MKKEKKVQGQQITMSKHLKYLKKKTEILLNTRSTITETEFFIDEMALFTMMGSLVTTLMSSFCH